MALRALMMDLDGTLARTSDANLRAYVQALQEYGVEVPEQQLEARIGGRHWKQFLPDILTEANSSHHPAAIAARKAEIYASALADIELNTELLHVLRSSRPHLKTALVTSASRISVLALLEVHQLSSLFETVVTGDDVQHHKPHPQAYQIAAERLDVLPHETLIYEDSDIGIASAEAFGGRVIRVLF